MLNSSLTISLGAGASDVSWGANANSREEVSMATLKVGPPLKQPLTDTITLNKIQWRYYHDNTHLREKGKLQKGNQPPITQQGREEREQESATIHKSKVDPL